MSSASACVGLHPDPSSASRLAPGAITCAMWKSLSVSVSASKYSMYRGIAGWRRIARTRACGSFVR